MEVNQDSVGSYSLPHSILNRLADGAPVRSDGLRCQSAPRPTRGIGQGLAKPTLPSATLPGLFWKMLRLNSTISINGCNKPVYLHGLNWSDPATEFGKTGADSKRSRTPF
ncbi:hypothetical protein CMK14_26485 [Candidatus Poribacteria bacterium]|nr:hypothetical protein [Candidatus Poribacteria bacterium]